MKSFKGFFLVLCLLNVSNNFAQDVIMVEHNLLTGDTTILNFGPNDIIESSGKTMSFEGTSNNYQILDSSTPEDNFTRLARVSNHAAYPLSTSIKISTSNEVDCQCTGTIISNRHILSLAPCFMEINANVLNTTSINILPLFNNGELHKDYEQIPIIKAYTLLDWDVSTDNFILLEVEEDLGQEIGWQGIAFNDEDDALRDQVFHKYSFPCKTEFIEYEGDLNGDTLYHSYGVYNLIDESIATDFSTIGLLSGEGGSAIFLSEDTQNHVYGIGTWHNRLRHSRISSREFYAMNKIIESFLAVSTNKPTAETIKIYPNPTADKLTIDLESFNSFRLVHIYSSDGKLVFKKLINPEVAKPTIQIKDWATGTYFMRINADNREFAASFIKH